MEGIPALAVSFPLRKECPGPEDDVADDRQECDDGGEVEGQHEDEFEIPDDHEGQEDREGCDEQSNVFQHGLPDHLFDVFQ